MIPLGRLRSAALVAVACAGLLAGHALTYLQLSPSRPAREAMLAGSGHGYLDTAVVVAGALAVMLALFWIADGFFRSGSSRLTLRATAGTLGMIQVLGFATQEVLERVVAGAPLRDLGTVLLVGLPIQLVVAAVGALLVMVLHQAGERLGSILSGAGPAQSRPAFLPPFPVRFHSPLLAGGLRTRGPPVPKS